MLGLMEAPDVAVRHIKSLLVLLAQIRLWQALHGSREHPRLLLDSYMCLTLHCHRHPCFPVSALALANSAAEGSMLQALAQDSEFSLRRLRVVTVDMIELRMLSEKDKKIHGILYADIMTLSSPMSRLEY